MNKHGFCIAMGCVVALAFSPSLVSGGVSPLFYPACMATTRQSPQVIEVTAINITSPGYPLWTPRQVDVLSSHVAGLETTIRHDLGDIHKELNRIDAERSRVLAELGNIRAGEHQGFDLLSSGLQELKISDERFTEDFNSLVTRFDGATARLELADTNLVDDINWLDRAVLCLALGLVSMAVILLCRFSGSNKWSVASDDITGEPIPPPLATHTGSTHPLLPAKVPLVASPTIQTKWGIIEDMNTVFVGLQSMAAELGSTSCTALNEKVAAVASVKGHVRCENQDYCLGFEIGNITVELIADGCGATPHGTFASYAAVKEAARFIVRNLTHDNHQDIVPLARQALFHASGMMVEYAASAKPPVVDGFRTTLIVILADSKRYAFAYAGDGGGVVVRKNGNFEKFLFPQKADAEIMNVLATSLGPELDGEPASGAIPRYRGDTLIIGSDGIWDHVGPNFPLAATHSLAKAGGNVRLASEAIIQDLADFTDVKGHICTDNLTIGLMADSINADKPRKSNALAST